MKKFISIILALAMMSGSVLTISSFAVTEGNTSSENTISLDEFTSSLSEINADYPPVPIISSVDPEFDTDYSSGESDPEAAEEPTDGIEDSLEDSIENNYETMRLIVKTNSNEEIDEDCGAIAKVEGFNNLHILQYESVSEMETAKKYYELQSDSVYVQEDKVASICTVTIYDDSHDFEYLDDYIVDNSISQSTVKVGVLDTGVDDAHEIFNGRTVEQVHDYFTGTDTAVDGHGHGTSVAGLVAQYSTSYVEIYAYKVMNDLGQGTDTTICAGIYDAVDDNMDVINMSLGGYGEDPLMEEAVSYAHDNGTTVVVAAGNDSDLAEYYHPAGFDDVITVSVFDNTTGEKASYSNFGDAVDIAAIGGNLHVATIGGNHDQYLDGNQARGTSFAAPIVAAAAAMVKSLDNTLNPDQIKSRLEDGATPVEDDSGCNFFGAGIVNFVGAANISRYPTPTVSSAGGRYESVQGTWNATLNHSDPNATIYYNTSGLFADSVSTMSLWTECSPGDTITLSGICALRAIAFSPNGGPSSQIMSECYEIATLVPGSCLELTGGEILSCSIKTGLLKIPETVTVQGENVTITSVGDYAFAPSQYNNTAISGIILPDTVEIIRIGAFSFYTQSQTFPSNSSLRLVEADGVTVIEEYAFAECVRLRKCNVENACYIGDRAFYKTFNLYDINIPNVNEISYGVFMYSSITSLNNLNELMSISELSFYKCPLLRSLSSTSLQGIGSRAFEYCPSLTDVDAPALEYLGERAFYYNVRLRTVHLDVLGYDQDLLLPDECSYGLSEESFFCCNSLEELYCPEVETVSTGAIFQCISLRYLELPSLVELHSLPRYLEIIIVSNSFQTFSLLKQGEVFYSPINVTVYGTAGSYAQTWAANMSYTFIATPAFIQNVPTYITSDDTEISVDVAGFNKTYQWYYNTTNSNTGGTAIQGADEATLTLPTTGYHEYYYCVVTSTDNNVTATNTSNVTAFAGIFAAPGSNIKFGSENGIETEFGDIIYGLQDYEWPYYVNDYDDYVTTTGGATLEMVYNSLQAAGTGAQLVVKYNNVEVKRYTIIVFGDVNGDCLLESTDISIYSDAVYFGNHTFLAENVFADPYSFAADINGNGEIDRSDVTYLLKASEYWGYLTNSYTSYCYQDYNNVVGVEPMLGTTIRMYDGSEYGSGFGDYFCGLKEPLYTTMYQPEGISDNLIPISGATFSVTPKISGYEGTGTVVTVRDADDVIVEEYTVIVFGDLDGDGSANGADATLLSAYLNSTGSLDQYQLAAADADDDGDVDSADAAYLIQAGLLNVTVNQLR